MKTPKTKELSPEEIKDRERIMKEYYEEKLPLLRLQHEHDTLVTGIRVAKVNYLRASAELAKFELSQKEQKFTKDGSNKDREDNKTE